MNQQALAPAWDQFRQKYGVYLRLLESLPADCLHTHPVPGMRTAAELAVHVSGTVVRDFAQGVAKGAITPDESAEADVARSLDKGGLIAFARTCFEQANAAVATIRDDQLRALVPTPWGKPFLGWGAFEIMRDEFLHHRGQLFVYARLAGIEPPFIWAFAENEAEYRPAAAPQEAAATA
jgi:uncharacterized damage-inducible protein DinB